jgi:hypothetical protein
LPSEELSAEKGFNLHGSPASKMSVEDRRFSEEADEDEDEKLKEHTTSEASQESSFQIYSKTLDSIMQAADPADNRRLLKIHANAIDANLFAVLISTNNDAETVCASLRLMAAFIQENMIYVKKFLSPVGEGEAW